MVMGLKYAIADSQASTQFVSRRSAAPKTGVVRRTTLIKKRKKDQLKNTNGDTQIMSVEIFHNPRCSKSRQTLALLQENGVDPVITEYLVSPPSKERLTEILDLLNMKPRDLMRKGEAEYKENNLGDPALGDAKLIQAMVDHPKLIERPIVFANGKARVGRPPESVLDIL